MIAILVWTLRAWRWRIVGIVGMWQRRPASAQPQPCPRCALAHCDGTRCRGWQIVVVDAPQIARVDLGERIVELSEERIAWLALMRRAELDQ